MVSQYESQVGSVDLLGPVQSKGEVDSMKIPLLLVLVHNRLWTHTPMVLVPTVQVFMPSIDTV
jgi:hypothetical protein